MAKRTQQYVNAWVSALEHRDSTFELLQEQNRQLERHTQALGDHLAPPDMKVDEVIGFWHYNKLIRVKCIRHYVEDDGSTARTYVVAIRHEDKPEDFAEPKGDAEEDVLEDQATQAT